MVSPKTEFSRALKQLSSKQERFQTSYIRFHFKKLKKQEQMKQKSAGERIYPTTDQNRNVRNRKQTNDRNYQ